MKPRERRRVSHPVGGEKITDESQADSCDVNTIVKQFVRTGLMPQRQGARYEDVSSNDYMAMRNFIADKEALFGGLPARLRARFGGDFYQLLRWIEDPANREEAQKLGILKAAATPQTKMAFVEEEDPPEDGEIPDSEAVKADEEAQPARQQKPKKPAPKGGRPA